MLSTVVPGVSREPQPAAGSVQHHDAGGRSTEPSAHDAPARGRCPFRTTFLHGGGKWSTSPVSQLTRPFSGKCGFSLTLSGPRGCLRLCPSHTTAQVHCSLCAGVSGISCYPGPSPGSEAPELLCCLRVDFLPPAWSSKPVAQPPPGYDCAYPSTFSVPLPRSEHPSPTALVGRGEANVLPDQSFCQDPDTKVKKNILIVLFLFLFPLWHYFPVAQRPSVGLEGLWRKQSVEQKNKTKSLDNSYKAGL